MGSDRLSDSSIIQQSYRQCKYDVRGISKFSFIFFQINGINIELYIVQNDSNNIHLYIIFIFSKFYAKGSTIELSDDRYAPFKTVTPPPPSSSPPVNI